VSWGWYHWVNMRVAVSIALSVFVLIGVAYLALHVESSIAKDEYVKVEAPQVTLLSDYDEGIHTIAGSLRVPTPCTPVSAASVLTADGTIRVDVTVGEDTDICLMRATEKEFSVDFEAPEEATIAVYVNEAKAVIVEIL